MDGREKDEWAMKGWTMYDVPLTFSILAPSANAAEAYAREVLKDFPPKQNSPAYDDDHIFVDGYAPPKSQHDPYNNPRKTLECDCMGH